MAKMMMLQQSQPCFSLLASYLSEFKGAKLHLQVQHFLASVEKAKHVLGWKPEFDLVEGLTDSYNLDFGRGTFRKEAEFTTTDDMVLSKKLVPQS